jgi:hypothetical protein
MTRSRDVAAAPDALLANIPKDHIGDKKLRRVILPVLLPSDRSEAARIGKRFTA